MNARVLAPHCIVLSTAAITKKRLYFNIRISEWRCQYMALETYRTHNQADSHMHASNIGISEWRCQYTALAAHNSTHNQADSHIHLYLYPYVVSSPNKE
jgi:hypothetical protein